jgi:hypothetical protein
LHHPNLFFGLFAMLDNFLLAVLAYNRYVTTSVTPYISWSS